MGNVDPSGVIVLPRDCKLTMEFERDESGPTRFPQGAITVPLQILNTRSSLRRLYNFCIGPTQWETLRTQMRRKGRPGWRHWRGYGRG